MKRARKGSGSVYRPKYKKSGALVYGGWRVRYRWNGKLHDLLVPADRPNSKAAAQEFLKQRFAEHTNGEVPDVSAEKLRYLDLRDGLLRYHETNNLRSLLTARNGSRYLSGQSHLDRFFGAWNPRALEITTRVVNAFKEQRVKDGASNANINGSLKLLRRMFNIAIDENEKLRAHAPKVTLRQAPAARSGFLEPDEFRRLHAALDADLQPVALLGFDTGMRLGEIANLRWSTVDLDKGEIRLSAEDTKTKVARTIPLGRVLAILKTLHMQRKNPEAPYVFGVDGLRPLGDFRKRWYAACVATGFGHFLCVPCGAPLPATTTKCAACSCSASADDRKYVGKTFHDLRRSAVRNMIRSGISETVAMKISGHRTRAVFDRYNITSTTDLHDAARKQNQYVEAPIVTTHSKEGDFDGQKRSEEKPLIQ